MREYKVTWFVCAFDKKSSFVSWEIPISEDSAWKIAEYIDDIDPYDSTLALPYDLEGEALGEAEELAGFEREDHLDYELNSHIDHRAYRKYS
ncbi:DUF7683 domain-containing protein [Haloactinospora alba]|uniref:DUF7683 domain-containing protein n=1 Tax=Haloactinospora alba TaxID=405555 RepID=UPI00115175DB|nr:hypothetical protein [Haloactinospora alba]